MFETNQCPNCKTFLPGGATYCAKCGFGTKDGEPRKALFSWFLIAAMLFLVPFAICGGCIALGYSYDGPNKGAFNTFATLFFVSIGIGILMILVNIVAALWRSGK